MGKEGKGMPVISVQRAAQPCLIKPMHRIKPHLLNSFSVRIRTKPVEHTPLLLTAKPRVATKSKPQTQACPHSQSSPLRGSKGKENGVGEVGRLGTADDVRTTSTATASRLGPPESRRAQPGPGGGEKGQRSRKEGVVLSTAIVITFSSPPNRAK